MEQEEKEIGAGSRYERDASSFKVVSDHVFEDDTREHVLELPQIKKLAPGM